MARLAVFWTETAVRQRNQVFEYWNNRNKSTNYSKKLNQKIKERTNLLKDNPKLGFATVLDNIRVTVLYPYSLIYKVEGVKIFIIGFWDTRQDPKKLLKFLHGQ